MWNVSHPKRNPTLPPVCLAVVLGGFSALRSTERGRESLHPPGVQEPPGGVCRDVARAPYSAGATTSTRIHSQPSPGALSWMS